MKKGKAFQVLISIVIFLSILISTVYLHWPDQYVHVTFCDVGQGDAILVTYQFTQILIDSGPDNTVLRCLQKKMPFWDKTIEVIIPTHSDLDHSGGFAEVLSKYTVTHIYTVGYGKNTTAFEKFRVAIRNQVLKGAQLHLAKKGDHLNINSIFNLEIIYPFTPVGLAEIFSREYTETQLSAIYSKQEQEYGNANDLSIALFLNINRVRVLLTADIEEKGELALIESELLGDINVLKAGHHGSKTSNTRSFLEKVRPEYVVISSGKNNRYGHPHKQVLENFSRINARILRTDQQGSIEMISNGSTFWWR